MDRRDPKRSLSALFDREHARALVLLADVQYLCGRGSYLPAAKVFAEFRMLQEQHLLREEELLRKMADAPGFPRLLAEQAVAEHAQLHQQMNATWEAMSRADRETFDREVAKLSEAIIAHEEAEKQQLLPALEAALHDQTALEREIHHLLDRAQEPAG
jgi:hemerythrin